MFKINKSLILGTDDPGFFSRLIHNVPSCFQEVNFSFAKLDSQKQNN